MSTKRKAGRKETRFVVAVDTRARRRAYGVFHFKDVKMGDSKCQYPRSIEGRTAMVSGFEMAGDAAFHCEIINERMGWGSDAFHQWRMKYEAHYACERENH